MPQDYLVVRGARQHNLKNIHLKIPKNKFVVFTGLSGSGKSSLAFDTIYAEGQRRYVESLSSYARQFLGLMNKPDVDGIDGLSPAISINQKAASHNPRSTVGTVTEIYDYLRLLFARIGHPHCPKCGQEIAQQSSQQISHQIYQQIRLAIRHTPLVKFMLLSPLVRDRKGEFRDLFSNLKKQGFQRVRVDQTIYRLDEDILLLKNNQHTISAVIERFTFDQKRAKSTSAIKQLQTRLAQAIDTSLKLSGGLVILSQIKDKSLQFPDKPKQFQDQLYSERFACPTDNISLPEIEPRIFSFNSPHGACSSCNGLGFTLKVDPELIIAPNLSIAEGAIIPYAAAMSHDTWFRRTVDTVLNHHGFSIKTPFKDLPNHIKQLVLYGTGAKKYTVTGTNVQGRFTKIHQSFEGFIPNLEHRYSKTNSDHVRNEIKKYLRQKTCPNCQGARLKPQSLSITINSQNIHQITSLPINQALSWVKSLPKHISAKENNIAALILKQLQSRLQFLVSVGLNYLTLNRQASTLAGGESQRIRLASQIGTGLTGVLYVLDEPTIGLHQRDNLQLIHTLKNLKNLGNTIIVVEHDQETIESADWIVDFGPGAGKHGGQIIAQGSLSQIKKTPQSLTGKYLSGKKQIKLTAQPTKQPAKSLTISGCTEYNLKNLTVNFPLGKFICVTGVSGSGKSTLIHTTLYHALAQRLNPYHRQKAGAHTNLSGTHLINRVSLITQNPIGRTPRSNPVTYTKAFDYIRALFALTPESKVRGYRPGRFSFNVKGGRCEVCRGGGEVKIEMQFLPDVYVKCDVCHGQRYNSETLQVRYKGKTISDVLELTVDEALQFFSSIPQIKTRLATLQQVGLGYIELGQPAPQLSGGEAQRIKLAKELSVKSSGHTVYLLDEPTTGLHFEDLKKLLYVLRALVAQGNTVIVIEHNLDIIKNADWIIDLGPEGGNKGGNIVAQGTPQHVSQNKKSYTGQFLKKLLH